MRRRIAGALFLVIGVAVAAHTIMEPLYYVSTEAKPYSPVWDYLDPLMAMAVLFGIAYAALRKRAVDGADDEDGRRESVTRKYVSANALFYGFLFVGILFFFSWTNNLSPGFTALGPEAAAVLWGIVDAALPLLCGALGVALVRDR